MRVALASDHAGYPLKEGISTLIKELGHICQDFGAFDSSSSDYPDYALPVARGVARGEFERGILICGSGVGMSISANKVNGVRAALCHDTLSARHSRSHVDANILCLGARVIGPGLAGEVVRVWLSTEFSGEERHRRRIQKMMALEGSG